MRTVHVVVPGGIDDLAKPSGGNVYDRRICGGLASLGWDVHEHEWTAGGRWPDDEAQRALARVIADMPDGAVVLVDGLIGSTVPAVLVPHSRRLRWSCSSIFRSATGHQGTRSPTPGTASAPCWLPRPRSSRRAGGRATCFLTCTRCGQTTLRLPSPAPTPPNSRRARLTAVSCSALPRSPRTRDTTSCSRPSPPSPIFLGVVSLSEPRSGSVNSPISCSAGRKKPALAIGSCSPARAPAQNSTGLMPPRTSSSFLRSGRPTGWSSPRR